MSRIFAFVAKDQRERVDPPPQRARVLAFIKSEIAAGREFPSDQSIAAHMGWKHGRSAYVVLCHLIGDGHIIREYDRSSGTTRVAFKLNEP